MAAAALLGHLWFLFPPPSPSSHTVLAQVDSAHLEEVAVQLAGHGSGQKRLPGACERQSHD